MKKFILIAFVFSLLCSVSGRTQTLETGPAGIEKLSTVTPEALVIAQLVYDIETVAPAVVLNIESVAVNNAGTASGYYDQSMNATLSITSKADYSANGQTLRRRVNDTTTEKLKGNKIRPAYSMANR